MAKLRPFMPLVLTFICPTAPGAATAPPRDDADEESDDEERDDVREEEATPSWR